MLAELEAAIIDRLKTAWDKATVPALSYRVPTIDSYGGQIVLDEAGRATLMQTVALPALFVTLGELKTVERTGERSRIMQQDITVYCCTYNVRNEGAQRLGDKNEVGSYQLSEDVAELLSNQAFGLDGIDNLTLQSIAPMFGAVRAEAKAINVRAVHLRTRLRIVARLPKEAELADTLARINDGFYLPKPGGEDGELEAAPRLQGAVDTIVQTP